MWIPSQPLSSPPTSWASYLHPSILPTPLPSTAQIHGVFLEALSPILTIYASLPSPPTHNSLIVQIIDPLPTYTGLHLPAYEELLHLLPTITSLDLYLIGPNVPSSLATAAAKQTTCSDCTASKRTRSAHWISASSYSSLPSSVPKPDIIAAFSPAISASVEYWTPILKGIHQQRIPAVFTAKTEEEAIDDMQTVREVMGVKEGSAGLWGPERSVWAGGRPNVDGWEEDGVWRENAFVWGIWQNQKP